jgi:hypothetical protein
VKYLVFTYVNRAMKPVEIALRRWGEEIKEKDRWGEFN